jgi:hypothetical protein
MLAYPILESLLYLVNLAHRPHLHYAISSFLQTLGFCRTSASCTILEEMLEGMLGPVIACFFFLL